MITQVMKRYKDFKFSYRHAVKALCFFTFLILFGFIYHLIGSVRYFPIQEVKIVGSEHISHQEIQQVLLPLVKKGFFKVDVDLIRDRLLQFPWVADAFVRRVWPNEIIIRLTEKNALARWNNDSLLSTKGEIFSPVATTFPLGLPQFVGPLGEQMEMLSYYATINDILKKLHFKIIQFELTSTGAWQMIFSNGIKLNVGYKDILTRINHFVRVYPVIIGDRAKDVDYVDLRYANGLAVRWKTIT